MKPNDTVTHVALPDRVLTVAYADHNRVVALDSALTIADTADNFRPYPPRKSTTDLQQDVTAAIQSWHDAPPNADEAETRALIAAAQAYLDRLEEQ